MRITCWSYANAHSSTSSNTLALASYFALQLATDSDARVSLIQAQFRYNNLDYPLLGKRILKDDFFGTGIDALLSVAKSRGVTEHDAHISSISLYDDKLRFYRSTRMNNKESYYKEMEQFPKIVKALDEYSNFVFVDLGSGLTSLTIPMLQQTDVLLVMLPQNGYFINETLKTLNQAQSLLNVSKIFYCVGDYHSDSTYSLKNLQSMFHQLKGKMFAIPHDMDFGDAISGGKVVDFFLANDFQNMKRRNPHYPLKEQLQTAYKLIRRGMKD